MQDEVHVPRAVTLGLVFGVLLSLLAVFGCSNMPPIELDCRTLGCSAGQECKQQEGGTWSCVPKEEPPPPEECLPGVPWCNELDPPAQCSAEERPCKHNPTTDPEHCELAPACPPPPKPPDPDPGPPDPEPPAPAPPGTFPVRFPKPGTTVYSKAARWNRGVDYTPRMRGDRELCELLAHVAVPSADCHFDSDVWRDTVQRAEYEAWVLAGARDGQPLPERALCPTWEFRSGELTGRCHDDREGVPVSCDHFGSVGAEDDPQTPDVFEGAPALCGLQRDAFGPYAGFFMVPQCPGGGRECSVRSCSPIGDGCSDWLLVTWREP